MTEQLLRLFATPVIVDQLGDAEALNAALEPKILDRFAQEAGMKLSNRGGWQSKRDFPRWAGHEGQKLVERALELASAHVRRANGTPPRWTADMWANVSGLAAFNMPHVHTGTFWSAVYYVRVGEGEGGQLVLHDPRMPGLRMHAPGVLFRNMGPELKAEIEPKAGMLVLFPAWLSHSVEPWQGTGQRISVAMNIRAATLNR
jgi:uncharacterized protein (TIGR02466 family)